MMGLAFLSAGQAQKEIVHNEALQTLDLLVCGAVEEAPRPDPPASPALGQCFIVGAGASAEWIGKDRTLVGYTSGGWRHISPQDGMITYVKSTSTWACYRNSSWELGAVRGSSLVLGGVQVVGQRLPAIPDPAGGTNVDVESRSAIGQILAALRGHGLIEG
jgi:hypothetical protein